MLLVARFANILFSELFVVVVFYGADYALAGEPLLSGTNKLLCLFKSLGRETLGFCSYLSREEIDSSKLSYLSG